MFPPLGDFCARHGITSNAQLREHLCEQATPAIRGLVDFLSHTVGINALNAWPDLPAALRDAAAAGYTAQRRRRLGAISRRRIWFA